MNINNLKVQMQTAEALGRDLEKQKEELNKEKTGLQGAIKFLQKVESDLNKQTQKVKSEVMGENPEISLREPLEIAKYVVEQLMLASRNVHEHMERAAVAVPITEGKIQGLDMALKNAHKVYKSNAERLEAIYKDITEGKAVMDSSGMVEITAADAQGLQGAHPGLSEKARSMEEDEVKETKGSKKRKKSKSITNKNPKKRGKNKTNAKDS